MPKNFYDRDYGWEKLYTTFKFAKSEQMVQVGVFKSAGVYENSENLTVAQVAAIHEFGSKDGRIPERSFIRSSIDSNAKQIEKLIKKLTAQIFENRITTKFALGIVGQYVKDKMISKINKGISPANKPSTITRKGSSKPLIDTGQLKGSIDWHIIEGDKVTGSGSGKG